ncbi:hypothetical protein [Pigmentiphaga sp. CHJ604]|uniref:hypothetical protein n=1 Tax=Pigmentiphaga sp. CHJ604 TaxID=3081984 RepID=UPI0030CA7439
MNLMSFIPPWARYGAVAALAAAATWYGPAIVQKSRLEARNSDQAAEIAQERAAHADVARTAEADQRAIEFNRMEANAHVTYQTQQRLDAAAAALRDREFAIVGLRNALAAAESRSSQAGGDPGSRIGADDPATLRTVVRECTAEYSEMAGNAVGAGVAATGLQEYAVGIQQ